MRASATSWRQRQEMEPQPARCFATGCADWGLSRGRPVVGTNTSAPSYPGTRGIRRIIGRIASLSLPRSKAIIVQNTFALNASMCVAVAAAGHARRTFQLPLRPLELLLRGFHLTLQPPDFRVKHWIQLQQPHLQPWREEKQRH